ncbi:palmitoyltransferase ZDHHC11 [Plodia interpunctella]|uniref:palmitoyltransferase ZDHHC11 n=1 Tax=Plodia interpunctella TaxID=58824 RepID=UPI003100C67C
MHRCCTSSQARRSYRRINGLELPLNYQQVIGWIVFIATGLVNFFVLVQIQFDELKITSLIVYVFLYVSHIVAHITASYIDPSEDELRKLPINNVPEFDRGLHTHVIENGRCHLCNIYTSSKNTKHCSLCNKCIDHFDHHCKWLNNCIGQRNYTSFVASVTTALLISVLTSSLCITDIVMFFVYPQKLSNFAQNFIKCPSMSITSTEFCKNSVIFLGFLIFFCVSAFAIACALLHLCCFHIYISILGVSTYEYIMKSGTPEASSIFSNNCRILKIPGKMYVSKSTERNKVEMGTSECATTSNGVGKLNSSPASSNTNVANLIGILINNELDRAKRIFIYDKNKIHPQKEQSGDIES